MKTKHVQYETHGTCSRMIDVTADENNVIQQVFFLGGCNGNLQGISQLVRGQKIDDVIRKIRHSLRRQEHQLSRPARTCPRTAQASPPRRLSLNRRHFIIFSQLRPILSFFYGFSWIFQI